MVKREVSSPSRKTLEKNRDVSRSLWTDDILEERMVPIFISGTCDLTDLLPTNLGTKNTLTGSIGDSGKVPRNWLRDRPDRGTWSNGVWDLYSLFPRSSDQNTLWSYLSGLLRYMVGDHFLYRSQNLVAVLKPFRLTHDNYYKIHTIPYWG